MADPFRPVFEALKQVADGLIMANQGIIAANEGIKTLANAVLSAREEHEDLRETVHRLESLVIAQGHDLRALRDRLDSRE
jgi:hypothetical protein